MTVTYRTRAGGRYDEAARNEAARTDEAAIALHTADAFAQLIQNADAKAAILATVQGGVLVGTLTQQAAIGVALRVASPLGGIALAVLALLLAALLMSALELGRCQVPRLVRPAEPNRFALPDAARRWHPDPGPDRLAGEAWEHARLLAWIAERKFRHLRRALCWAAPVIAGFVAWMLLAALLGGAR